MQASRRTDFAFIRMSEEVTRVLDTKPDRCIPLPQMGGEDDDPPAELKIINISSVSGVSETQDRSNYSASKAGLIGMTKSVKWLGNHREWVIGLSRPLTEYSEKGVKERGQRLRFR